MVKEQDGYLTIMGNVPSSGRSRILGYRLLIRVPWG